MKKHELDTPFVLIDLDKVEKNIQDVQRVANENGIGVRPHAKTHKMPEFAHMQINGGAIGITVAKIGEAEVMAEGGVKDIFIAYPIVGVQKTKRLAQLAKKVKLTVAVDRYETAAAISEALQVEGNATIGVVVETDCGFGRVGITDQQEALSVAKQVAALPGIRLRGVMTFAGQSYDAKNEEERTKYGVDEGKFAVEIAQLLKDNGLEVDMVSVGSTPSSQSAATVSGVTEIRPGTYIFGDLTQVAIGAHALEDCALTVKATIVSRPSPERAVIDGGTKVFTMDGEDSPIGTGRGYVKGHPGIIVSWFTEEHGMLILPPEEQHLDVGDTLEIVPVHACAVVNMFDEVAVVRNDEVEAIWEVVGRGKVR